MNTGNIRQCFYMGQNVKAENLNQLQDFSMGQDDLRHRDLFGKGIGYGFDVVQVDTFKVGIMPGVAYNAQGQRLNLEQEQSLDVTEFAPMVSEKVLYIGAKLGYEKTMPIVDTQGNTVNTVWSATTTLEVLEAESSEFLTLAEIRLSPVGIVNIQQDMKDMLGLSFGRLKELLYPIGYQYTQLPDPNYFNAQGIVDFNPKHAPSFLFGGTWELIWNDSGAFERFEGGNSLESRGIDGIQHDAIQDHTHQYGMGSWLQSVAYSSSSNEKAFPYNAPHNLRTGTHNGRFSHETRPINILKRTWLRIG